MIINIHIAFRENRNETDQNKLKKYFEEYDLALKEMEKYENVIKKDDPNISLSF